MSAGDADLEVGEVLEGTWRLERAVGRGGMGTVFLATDIRLGRKVAVKTLSTRLAGEEFMTRFEQEARVLASLDHPNIVTLHRVGRHRQVPFIVMRYLEGRPLPDYVAERGDRLGEAELLSLAQQLCAALGYIHQKGVVHRDLKPSNIIIDAAGQLTVFDLGIARPRDSHLTQTGVIFGTPGYMAPELIVGEKVLDGRLDLYALGVILYELATGEPPFSDSHEESLLRAHLMKPRPDASLACLEVSPALAEVLQKAMALEPKDRYQDADQMAAALEAALEPALGPAVEPAMEAVLEPPPRRKPRQKPRPRPAAAALLSPRPPPSAPRALQPRARRKGRIALWVGLCAAALVVGALSLWSGLRLVPSDPGPRPSPPAPTVRAPPRVEQTLGAFSGPSGYGELRIDVTVGGRPVAAQLHLDDRPVGSSPLLVPVKAGVHRLGVAHPAQALPAHEVRVPAGKSVGLRVELQP